MVAEGEERDHWWSAFPGAPQPPAAKPSVAATLVIGILPGVATFAAGGGYSAVLSVLIGLGAARVAARSADPPTTHLMMGLSAAAAFIGWRFSLVAPTLGLQAAAVAIGLGGARTRRRVGALNEGVGKAASAAGRGIATVGMGMVAIPIVLLPWFVQRLARWDATSSPRPADSRLTPRSQEDGDPRRSWSATRVTLPEGPHRSMHRVGVILLAVALAVGFYGSVAGVMNRLQTGPDLGAPAMEASSWWRESRITQFRVFERARWSAYLGPTASETDGPYVHVHDGRRNTWRPPEDADDVAVKVWVFGGSAAFGIGQRDEHTIASELARIAWEDRRRLNVENFGFHGDVHWMAQARLVDALAEEEQFPDVVVFYDGFNEIPSVGAANLQNGRMLSPFVGSLDTLGIDPPSSPLRWIDRHLRGDPTAAPPSVQLTDVEVERAGIAQYRSSVENTIRFLEGRGLTGHFFFQPSRASRFPQHPDEGWIPENARRSWQRFRQALPDSVVDLGDVFNKLREPVYMDDVHTNELGARIVAETIYRELIEDLDAASTDLLRSEDGEAP